MLYPYVALNVPETASTEQIRLAYLNGIRNHPPDQDSAGFQQIREAYESIRDDVARARLRLFGMPGDPDKKKLAELIPRANNQRRKTGMEKWLAINR